MSLYIYYTITPRFFFNITLRRDHPCFLPTKLTIHSHNDGIQQRRHRIPGRKTGVPDRLRSRSVSEARGCFTPQRSEVGVGLHRRSFRRRQLHRNCVLEGQEDGGCSPRRESARSSRGVRGVQDRGNRSVSRCTCWKRCARQEIAGNFGFNFLALFLELESVWLLREQRKQKLEGFELCVFCCFGLFELKR